jgi:hypothetical protein
MVKKPDMVRFFVVKAVCKLEVVKQLIPRVGKA